MYPPHIIALGSIYVAGLLLSFEQPPSPQRHGGPSSADVAKELNSSSSWEKRYRTNAGDLEGWLVRIVILIIHDVTDDNFCPQTLHIPSLTSLFNSPKTRLPTLLQVLPHRPRLTFLQEIDIFHSNNCSIPISLISLSGSR